MSCTAGPDTARSPEQSLDLDGMTLSYPKDPEKVILRLAVMVPQTALYRSMSLYGDGRVQLARLGSDLEVLRSHELRLDPGEATRLLSIVGRSRLPEYDLDLTAERVNQLRGGEELNLFFGLDHAITTVEIALDSYTNGSVALKNVDTRIVLRAAGAAAARYPEIEEFQAIVELTDLSYARWEEAFGSRW